MEHDQHIHLDLTEFLKHLTDKAMGLIDNLNQAIATLNQNIADERTQFATVIAAKDQEIADLKANAIDPTAGQAVVDQLNQSANDVKTIVPDPAPPAEQQP